MEPYTYDSSWLVNRERTPRSKTEMPPMRHKSLSCLKQVKLPNPCATGPVWASWGVSNLLQTWWLSWIWPFCKDCSWSGHFIVSPNNTTLRDVHILQTSNIAVMNILPYCELLFGLNNHFGHFRPICIWVDLWLRRKKHSGKKWCGLRWRWATPLTSSCTKIPMDVLLCIFFTKTFVCKRGPPTKSVIFCTKTVYLL